MTTSCRVPMNVTITCAGIGSRLGMGIPKALVVIGGKSILQRIADALDPDDNLTVVVGFRKDLFALDRPVRFVENKSWASTGPAASAALGLVPGLNLLVDGDVIPTRRDISQFRNIAKAAVGVRENTGTESCHVGMSATGDITTIGDVCIGPWREWACIATVMGEWFFGGSKHYIKDVLSEHLPLPGIPVDAHEVDTLDDLRVAEQWIAGSNVE